MAKLFHLLVNGGVLLYVGVGLRHVGLGLVVVVVAYEVDHAVVGKELLHLACDLGRQRLVGLHDERGLADRLDGLCHGKGLARTRYAHERLVAQALTHALRELFYGLRLIAARLVRRLDHEPLVAMLYTKALEFRSHTLACLRHDLSHRRMPGHQYRVSCHAKGGRFHPARTGTNPRRIFGGHRPLERPPHHM